MLKGTSYWSKSPGHGQYLASASDLFDPHPSWGDTLQGLDCHGLEGEGGGGHCILTAALSTSPPCGGSGLCLFPVP